MPSFASCKFFLATLTKATVASSTWLSIERCSPTSAAFSAVSPSAANRSTSKLLRLASTNNNAPAISIIAASVGSSPLLIAFLRVLVCSRMTSLGIGSSSTVRVSAILSKESFNETNWLCSLVLARTYKSNWSLTDASSSPIASITLCIAAESGRANCCCCFLMVSLSGKDSSRLNSCLSDTTLAFFELDLATK